MAPRDWEEEESDSTPPSSPPQAPVTRRGKFDDEAEDSDVVDSWDAADDSEAEREKAKKATEAKAKADAEAKANHKSKAERVAAHKENNQRRKAELDDDYTSDEDEDSRRARLKREQKEADMAHAEDLFGDLNYVSNNRSAAKPVTIQDVSDPNSSLDLSSLSLFSPANKDQFTKLRDTLVPLLNNNAKKAHYVLFMQEFTKQICKDLPSEQVKKIASGLTTLSNEKMKEEKAADKGGKKSKASKTKSSLVATRDISYRADISAYDGDDGLGDDDFM